MSRWRNSPKPFADVHVVDIAAALAAAGAERLLDDGQVGFTHFGSPGWMLQRPESEKAAVHDLFPDTAPLAASVGGDPYRPRNGDRPRAYRRAGHRAGHRPQEMRDRRSRRRAVARRAGGDRRAIRLDARRSAAPFPTSGFISALHEALKCLKQRGIVLACVSKNDEATVRELWNYPEHYPRERLLTPDDFVTWRVNWDDKVDNIRSIAEELGFALDTFLFIDDHPVERDRVRQQAAGGRGLGRGPFRAAPASVDRSAPADPAHHRRSRRAHRRWSRRSSARQQLRAEAVGRGAISSHSLRIQCRIERR